MCTSRSNCCAATGASNRPVSSYMFGRERLGQMWTDGMPPRVAEFVRETTSLEIVDITGAAGSTSGDGHSYFRDSPWVSSDMLTYLAYDIDPARRGEID